MNSVCLLIIFCTLASSSANQTPPSNGNQSSKTPNGVPRESDQPKGPKASLTKLRVKYGENKKFVKEFDVSKPISEIVKFVKEHYYNNENGTYMFVYNGQAIQHDVTLDEAGIFETVVYIERISNN